MTQLRAAISAKKRARINCRSCSPHYPDHLSEVEAPSTARVTEQQEVPLSIEGFWSGDELESFSVNISPPDVSAAIIKRLGTPQFWDSKDYFNKKMGGYYEEISRCAMEDAYGEQANTGKNKKKN